MAVDDADDRCSSYNSGYLVECDEDVSGAACASGSGLCQGRERRLVSAQRVVLCGDIHLVFRGEGFEKKGERGPDALP